ncbi:MAG: hypothetical protein OHK0039_11660 [Bacteroidia bacterium]
MRTCCDTYREKLGGDREYYTYSGHVVSENGKIFRLTSPRTAFCKIKIDGGLFPNSQPPRKCDWVFVLCDTGQIYFVELKGSSVPLDDACTQIRQTVDFFRRAIPDLRSVNMYAAIVGGRMPGQTARWRKKQEEFRGIHVTLERKDPIYELII